MTKYLDSAGLKHLIAKIRSDSGVRQAGLILPFAGEAAPVGYLICDGSAYAVSDYPELYAAIGNTYGGNSTAFNVPDLRGRVPLGNDDTYELGAQGGEAEHTLTVDELPSHRHDISVEDQQDYRWSKEDGSWANFRTGTGTMIGNPIRTKPNGGDSPHNNMQPYLAINYIISTGRVTNSTELTSFNDLVSKLQEIERSLREYLKGETSGTRKAGLIMPYASSTAPSGYLLCDGSSYKVSDYPELFAAIGTTYGGSNGSFNVPDLRGRIPLGSDDTYELASKGGEAEHMLTAAEMPSHSHGVKGGDVAAKEPGTGDSSYLVAGYNGAAYPTNMPFSIESSGSNQAHNNMQPYLAINYIISTGKTVNLSDLLTEDDLRSGPLPISEGGTGATNVAQALKNLGITFGTDPAPAMGAPGSIYIQIAEEDA